MTWIRDRWLRFFDWFWSTPDHPDFDSPNDRDNFERARRRAWQ